MPGDGGRVLAVAMPSPDTVKALVRADDDEAYAVCTYTLTDESPVDVYEAWRLYVAPEFQTKTPATHRESFYSPGCADAKLFAAVLEAEG